jgi:hypothetical protein
MLSRNSILLICRKEWSETLVAKNPELLDMTWFCDGDRFHFCDTSATGYSSVGCLKYSCHSWSSSIHRKLGCRVLCHQSTQLSPSSFTQLSTPMSTSTIFKNLWISWLTESWHPVIFNKMRWCVTYLTQPWEEIRRLSWKRFIQKDFGHQGVRTLLFELLPVRSGEE